MSVCSVEHMLAEQSVERSRPENVAEWRQFVQEEFVEDEGAQTGPERSGPRR